MSIERLFFVFNVAAPVAVSVAAPNVVNIVVVNAAAGLSMLTNITPGWK
jgi:hypothetical protein